MFYREGKSSQKCVLQKNVFGEKRGWKLQWETRMWWCLCCSWRYSDLEILQHNGYWLGVKVCLYVMWRELLYASWGWEHMEGSVLLDSWGKLHSLGSVRMGCVCVHVYVCLYACAHTHMHARCVCVIRAKLTWSCMLVSARVLSNLQLYFLLFLLF